MKKTKKTILFPEYFPFIAGGQNVLLNILENLRNEYDVRVLVFNRGEIERRAAGMGIKCDYMQAQKNARRRYFWKSIPLYFRLKRYIRENGIDLVYSNGYFTAKLMGPPAKACGVPVIWHKHQIITGSADSYLARDVFRFSAYADRMVCVSGASASSLEAIGVEKSKIIVIHNGINIPAIRRDTRKKMRKKLGIEGYFVAGTVGYFRKNKGFDTLIDAASAVSKKNSNIKFVITGSAEPGMEKYGEFLVEKAAKTKAPVIFTGKMDRYEIMPAFDIFVLPSIHEPFALSVLEAMSVKLPVVAFRSGGTPEAVKHKKSGLLAKELTPESLAEAVLEAAGKPGFVKKAGKSAFLEVKERFSLDDQMKKIRQIIKEVLK